MIPPSLKRLVQGNEATIIRILLVLATVTVYAQVRHFDFINLDDPFLIYNNPIVTRGWTIQGILWGLTTSYYEYWHPITWWSHMTDCQWFGLAAGWHHLVSLGYHVLNTLVLFAMLRQLTGFTLRSGMVAALFALHPMHVESVAWLAERKDLLGTLFWLLSIWAYALYVQESEALGANPQKFYRLSIAAFIGGLMSKPMVVTLPFVLLLLDYWPLNRLKIQSAFQSGATPAPTQIFFRLAREKLPFFVLTFLSCLWTLSNVQKVNNIISAKILPWSYRLGNMPVSYARYLKKLFWPVDLTVFYPMDRHWEFAQVGGAVLIVVIITALAVWFVRTAPYLLIGWLMFLGTIFPTLSLVPVGFQSIADRYTYLSYTGLFIAVVWAVGDLSARWRFRDEIIGPIAAVALFGCGYATSHQLEYWQNNFTLWPHCLAVTTDNLTAHYNYGYALQNAGHLAEAIPHYREALRIDPNHENANLNMGRALAATGKTREATNYFAQAIRLKPDSADAHGNQGMALFFLSDFSGAASESSEAFRLDPTDLRSQLFLGRSLSAQKKSDDAIAAYTQGLRLAPQRPEPHYFLGVEFLKRGSLEQAVEQLNEAVRLAPAYDEARAQLALAQGRALLRDNPESPDAINNLAWLLATQPNAEVRNGPEAVKLAERACDLTVYKQVVPIGTLAAAYAEAGKFDQAIAAAQRACDLASSLRQTNLAEQNRELLEEYKNHHPHREPTVVPPN